MSYRLILLLLCIIIKNDLIKKFCIDHHSSIFMVNYESLPYSKEDGVGTVFVILADDMEGF